MDEPIKADMKTWSLKDEPMTFRGHWLPDNPIDELWGEEPSRNVVIQGVTIRAFGIDWWTWKATFTATTEGRISQQSDGMVTASMNFNPTGQATSIKAEWWRRAGFHVIAQPYDWIAEHTVRPFARWVLDIEPDDNFEDED